MNAIINTTDVPVQIFSTWTEDFTRYENMELLNYWLTTKKNKENRQNYYSWKYIRNVQDVCLNKRPLISYCKNAMDQPNDLKREAFYTKVITLGAEKYFKI